MKCEVLVPGGSLDHGLWALEGGADAVYVGYQQFSARSHAQNLSLEDISGLTAAARGRGARVFCALNTILKTEEITQAVPLAWELFHRGVQALIVQDLGLALALKRHGPPLDLHASTQAAVHNPGGAKALLDLGFRRVVLARELTMAEIGKIAAAVPEMEFEVFVHGALCYAVSGNCMASGIMIGRSANRGDCGQICRTKFELDYLIPGPRRHTSPHEEGLPEGIHAPPGEITWKSGTLGAFASMNDLELGSRIRELRDLGVTSFKIEGRMKPPAYSFNTARAYKAFLEGGRDEEAWDLLDEARVSYGRLPSTGWFDGHKALAQTNPSWAGTLGLPLGVLTGGEGLFLKLGTGTKKSLLKSLSKGDGVMILGSQNGQTHRVALNGEVTFAGSQALLSLSSPLPFPPEDATLWLVSRHNGKLPVKKPGRPWRHPMDLNIRVSGVTGPEGTQGVRVILTTHDFGGLTLDEVLPGEFSRGDEGSLESRLEAVFLASDGPFGPLGCPVENTAGAVFVQPKLLKALRRRWYARVESQAIQYISQIKSEVESQGKELPDYLSENSAGITRALLSPKKGVNRLTGFVTEWENLAADQLERTPWGLALPLAPFTPDEESYYGRFRDFLLRIQGDGSHLSVFPGLSNPCQLTWVKRLRAEGFPLDSWFADWGFHSANPWTPVQLAGTLPGMVFAVHWLEDPDGPDKSYYPPLFTSRSCMLRNSFGDQTPAGTTPVSGSFDSRQWTADRQAGGLGSRPSQSPRCPAGCGGHFSARLVQGKKNFRVEARDCTNYLILEEPEKILKG